MTDKKHRNIRSFVLRKGRLTIAQQRALDELWPHYGIERGETVLDYEDHFGRSADVIVEIGFGNGEIAKGILKSNLYKENIRFLFIEPFSEIERSESSLALFDKNKKFSFYYAKDFDTLIFTEYIVKYMSIPISVQVHPNYSKLDSAVINDCLKIIREGIETVLFLAALSLTQTSDFVGFMGGLLGLTLALVFGILFIRGSLRINLRLFFAVTSFVLLILAVRLAAGSLHEFYEVGLIPLPHLVEEGIEFLTNKNTSTVLLITLVALPLLAMLPDRWLHPVIRRAAR